MKKNLVLLILLALFGTGMNLMVLAGSIDVLFAGWEFLGISSALLIGFFHERRNAVDAALRAFITYRICDVGLFGASVVIHRATGTGDFASLFSGDWPHATCLVAGPTAVAITLLFAFAALGKSAQVPFSGWLPRAMPARVSGVVAESSLAKSGIRVRASHNRNCPAGRFGASGGQGKPAFSDR